MGLIGWIPWWGKLATKVVLSRIPLPYAFWQKIGLFRHGETDKPELAIKSFSDYFEKAESFAHLQPRFHSLELGPGDSILTGLVARAYGAERVWLMDTGPYAETNADKCRETVDLLRLKGKSLPSIDQDMTVAQILRQACVNYLTTGIGGLARIPDASIDYVWSRVVLEHVARAEFPILLRELRRVMKSTAISVHGIDFRDHLGGKLNNLRFSGETWEGGIFKTSGFYTNRLRPREMLAMFEDAGFSVTVLHEVRWAEPPISRSSLPECFSNLTEEDLMTSELEIVAHPKT